jgi:hypothetical protein
VSDFYVQKLIKNQSLRSFKAIKYPNRTKKQQLSMKSRTEKLYTIFTNLEGCLILDDETYVKIDCH